MNAQFTNIKDSHIVSLAIATAASAPGGLSLPSAVSSSGLMSAALGFLSGGKPDPGSLDLALRSFARGGDALKALAISLDFKPPPADMMTGQSIVGWLDSATGRVFIAPTTGWQAPSATWAPALRVNPEWLAPFLGGSAGKPGQPVTALPDPAMPPPKPGRPEEPDREEPDDDDLSAGPVLGKPDDEDSPDDTDSVGLPGRPDPAKPGMPKPPLEELWSVARDLTDAEWLNLRKAMSVLHDGRDAVGELANKLGFKPPAEAGAAVQALIGWINESTGQIFIAPGVGWTPPDDAWEVVAKLPVGAGKPPLGEPRDDASMPPPVAHDPDDHDDAPDGRDPDDHDGVLDGHEPPAVAVDPVEGGRPLTAKWLTFAQDAIRMVDKALGSREPIEARLDLVQDPASPEGNTRIEYEWRVGDKVIEGATGMKLPVMPLLAGREVSFRMSVADAAGQPEIITRSIGVDETAKMVAGRLMHWSKKLAGDASRPDAASDAEVDTGVGLAPGANAAAVLKEMAGADRFEVEGIDFHRFAVRASAQVVDSERSAVGAADVLAALKLAHGRKLGARSDDAAESADADPFQLIAADIDGNGVIDRVDAESLLGAVVDPGHGGGRSRWLFVPERAELAGLSRKSVAWSEPPENAVDVAPANWIGVMLGDIDGSWKPDL